MDIELVKKIALENGFKLKEQASGNFDLNAYVYIFAEKLLESKQSEINELKAKLEKLEKSKSGVVLTCSQLLEAFQFGAPDGESDADQMATEMVIRWFEDGHSGAGYYCYYSDYPEDGAIFLGEEQEQSQ